jgi:translation initiation factor 4G
MTPTIRRAAPEDTDFIAWTILAAQRGHRPRGWFDIALDRPEPECLAFVRQITLTPSRSWWHCSQFLIAEVDGIPAAALCALHAGGAIEDARSAIAEAASAASLDATEMSAISRRGAPIPAHAGCWATTTVGVKLGWLLRR